MKALISLLASAVVASLAATAASAATFTIINNDAAGVGFNDPTVVAPVGGNTGTTLGQQRLNVYADAAAIWGAALPSNVDIRVRAQWTALTCTATSAVLGSAGSNSIFRDFPGAEFPSTWYGGALADKLSNTDQDPGVHDINANFNINLGNAGCLTGSFFYLGLDANHGSNVDFETVLLHELGHGLGFQTYANGATGALQGGFADIFARNLRDVANARQWTDAAETNANRAASSISGVGLIWTGTNTTNWAATHLGKRPVLIITAPAPAAGSYFVGTASFGPALTAVPLAGTIVAAIDPDEMVTGSTTTDACSALTNAAAIAGNIALVDRGVCGFTVKAANVQAAGAIAMIVADNVAGVAPPPGLGGTDPSITIPAVRILQSDGVLIRANLPATGSLGLDPVLPAGANLANQMFMYAPNPFQSGSSVSHFDTSATPNVLMEPAINGDLTHNLSNEATLQVMTDIGWFRTPLPVQLTTFSVD
ncbi:MAG: PA domain-containing protein [Dokdonella sp.]